MFIPAGKIAAGQTQYMAATFAVQSFPISTAVGASAVVGPPVTAGGGGGFGGGGGWPSNGFRVGPTMQIESRMDMAGRVRVLHFFTHHVNAKSGCRVDISVNDGSVLGFHC